MTSVPLQIKGKVITVAAGFGFYSITTDQNEVCIWGNTFSGSANYGKQNNMKLFYLVSPLMMNI